jgi:hypothetical protein
MRVPEIQPVLLQPQAAPVDTYVRPATPARSNLWDLAEALGGLESSLAGMVDKRKGEKDEAEALKGQMAFFQNNRQGFRDAVKGGVIPAHRSPVFVENYKKAEGKFLGTTLTTKFQTAYSLWDGKDSADEAKFQEFFDGWLASEVKGIDDPHVMAGLVPELYQLQTAAEAMFEQDLHDNVYNGATKLFGAMVGTTIDQYGLEGTGNEDGVDYNDLWNTLTGLYANNSEAGVREEDLNKQLVDSITAKAIEYSDTGLLNLLDYDRPGGGLALSAEPYGRDEKLKAQASIAAAVEADTKDRDAAALDKAWNDAIDHMIGKPGEPIPEAILTEGSRTNGKFRIELLAAQKALLDSTVTEDPQARTQLFADIFAGGGMKAIRDALARGIIKDDSTLQSAVSFARGLEAGEGTLGMALKGNIYEGVVSSIKARSTPDEITSPWAANGMSDAGLSALTDYNLMLVEWATKNPEATRDEVYKMHRVFGQMVLEGLPTQAEPGAAYTRPTGVQEQLGEGPLTEGAPAEPGPETPTPQPPPPANPVTGTPENPQAIPTDWGVAARQRFVDTLPPGSMEYIQNLAREKGVDVYTIINRMMDNMGEDAMQFLNPSLQPQQPAVPGPGSSLAPDGSFQVASAGGWEDVFGMLDPNVQSIVRGAAERMGLDLSGLQALYNDGNFQFPEGTDMAALPAGMRNNNPGNLKFSDRSAALYPGVMGPSENTDQGDPQINFKSPEDGMAAAAILALRKFNGGRDTVRKLISAEGGWTPGAEFATTNIAATMGVGPDDPLDLSKPDQMHSFLSALIKQEHGPSSELYTPELIMEGVKTAMEGPAEAGGTVALGGGAEPAQAVAFLTSRTDKPAEHITGLDPRLQTRLYEFINAAPPGIREGLGIYSGYRSVERQQQLWNQALRKYGSAAAARKWVAPPGRSNHNHGQAADLSYNGASLSKAPREVVQWVHANAGKFGLKFPLSNENWHVELQETRGGRGGGGFAAHQSTATGGNSPLAAGIATAPSTTPPPATPAFAATVGEPDAEVLDADTVTRRLQAADKARKLSDLLEAVFGDGKAKRALPKGAVTAPTVTPKEAEGKLPVTVVATKSTTSANTYFKVKARSGVKHFGIFDDKGQADEFAARINSMRRK